MAYFLMEYTIAQTMPVEISVEKFQEIENAIKNVILCLKIEEEWDILIGNFYDMERENLNAALSDMLFSDSDWQDFQDIRIRFARRLQNLLSSCKSYLDHTPHTLNRLDDTGGLKDRFVEATHRAYNSAFAYRFMDQLRNHAQHAGHPLHSAMFDQRRIERTSGDIWRFIAGANINIAELEANPKFKRSVLAEAKEKGENLDAFEMARGYVEKLCEVHQEIRMMLTAAGLVQRGPVADALKEHNGIALSIFEGENVEPLEYRRAVLIEPFDRFDRLKTRNGSLRNLSNSYASGELRLHGERR